MARRIVILGAGTGGTLTANRLRRACGDEIEIVVVDRDDRHVYQPGLLFVPFGLADPDEIVRSRRAQLHDGIEFRLAEIEHVDTAANTVHLDGGETIAYDVLVVASGAALLPEETEGLTGTGWGQKIFTFFELESATALRDALRRLRPRPAGRQPDRHADQVPGRSAGVLLPGRLVPARARRPRRRRAHLRHVAGRRVHQAGRLRASRRACSPTKGIALETEFATGEVDGEGGRLVSYDEREVPFDLLVSIPLHGGPAYVGRSPGLGDELGFVATDPHTLQAKAAPNVFAIGDATNLPTSKAGSVTHFEGDTLVANIGHFLAGEPLEASFDGHSNCFIETGFHKALLIDFNYDVEPLPGPLPRTAPRAAAAAQGIAAEPHGQARLPVGLLARAAPRPRHARHQLAAATRRQGPQPARRPPKENHDDARHPRRHPDRARRRGLLPQARAVDPRDGRRDRRATTASPSSPTATGRSSTTCAPPTSRPARRRRSARSGRLSGVPIKELYQLFPKGPAKLAAKIAGIPKPRGCI